MSRSEPVLGDIGEFELIDLLSEHVGHDPRVIVGIGDDAAAFEVPAGHVAVTTCDSQIEDVHFKKIGVEPQDVGWRAVAVNLSDLAAMGAEPSYILVSLALPVDLEASWIRCVYAGIAQINHEFAVSTIGGNISRTAGPIVIDITAIGNCKQSDLLLRSGARAGDRVVVTGRPGWSALGLSLSGTHVAEQDFQSDRFLRAHRRPTPRCKEGQIAARTSLAHAMIDVSDGLLADLGHICERSLLGAEIDVNALPLSGEFVDAATKLELDPVDLVLDGGEDYELLMAVPPSQVQPLASRFAESNLAPIHNIGVFTQEPGIRVPDRPDLSARPGGFTHF